MIRLTVAQALVRFLSAQQVERDRARAEFFAGCFGIFGHGNVAGLGQALHQYQDLLRYRPAHNEQGMVHAAAGYARQRNRLATFACTSSVGPGATNMVTGAAAATINGCRCCCYPATRSPPGTPHPVLQQLEVPHDASARSTIASGPCRGFYERIEAARAADARRARGDAGAHRPGRDGRGHAGAARGRAGRGVRRARRFLAPRVWTVYRQPPAREALVARGRADPVGPPAADRGRRRGDLQRGDGGAACFGRLHRDPGGARRRRDGERWCPITS